MMAWVDGLVVAAADAPKPSRGAFAPFETMGAIAAEIALWDRHLARLAATAAHFGLPFAARPELRAAAGALLLANGHSGDVLRLQLVPGTSGVAVVLTTRARSPVSRVRLLPTVVARPAGGPPADRKAAPRTFYDGVLQQAQDGGADDGIVVDRDGAVLETATCNLWLRLDGVWTTPPLDGRVLPGIARAVLLERARANGVEVVERSVDLGHLASAGALAVTNAVHGPRAAALVGEPVVAVEVVAATLGALWRSAAVG